MTQKRRNKRGTCCLDSRCRRSPSCRIFCKEGNTQPSATVLLNIRTTSTSSYVKEVQDAPSRSIFLFFHQLLSLTRMCPSLSFVRLPLENVCFPYFFLVTIVLLNPSCIPWDGSTDDDARRRYLTIEDLPFSFCRKGRRSLCVDNIAMRNCRSKRARPIKFFSSAASYIRDRCATSRSNKFQRFF